MRLARDELSMCSGNGALLSAVIESSRRHGFPMSRIGIGCAVPLTAYVTLMPL